MAANNLALEALLAGPRLIGRSPLAFVAWVGVRLVEQYASLAILLAARLGGAAPADHFHPLAGLEILVVLEEVPDLLQRDVGQVAVGFDAVVTLRQFR